MSKPRDAVVYRMWKSGKFLTQDELAKHLSITKQALYLILRKFKEGK